jgi:hypothetical protein
MSTFALFPTNSNITRKMDSDRDIAAELQTPLRGGVICSIILHMIIKFRVFNPQLILHYAH